MVRGINNANKKIPQALVNIFKPLFNELDQMDSHLDKNEFVDASTRLYETLS